MNTKPTATATPFRRYRFIEWQRRYKDSGPDGRFYRQMSSDPLGEGDCILGSHADDLKALSAFRKKIKKHIANSLDGERALEQMIGSFGKTEDRLVLVVRVCQTLDGESVV